MLNSPSNFSCHWRRIKYLLLGSPQITAWSPEVTAAPPVLSISSEDPSNKKTLSKTDNPFNYFFKIKIQKYITIFWSVKVPLYLSIYQKCKCPFAIYLAGIRWYTLSSTIYLQLFTVKGNCICLGIPYAWRHYMSSIESKYRMNRALYCLLNLDPRESVT